MTSYKKNKAALTSFLANTHKVYWLDWNRRLADISQKMKPAKGKRACLIDSAGGGVAPSFKTGAVRGAFEEVTVFVPHAVAGGGTMPALKQNSNERNESIPVDPKAVQKRGALVGSASRAKKRSGRKFERRQEAAGCPDMHVSTS